MNLRWLDVHPACAAGVTWGVPWEQGSLYNARNLALYDQDGRPIPLQSWPTAYWPDGSIKWTAHAAVIPPTSRQFVLQVGESAAGTYVLAAKEQGDVILVDNGLFTCCFNRCGPHPIAGVRMGGREVCGGAQLVSIRRTCIRESQRAVTTDDYCYGIVEDAVIEQHGPIRAVVRMTGRHVPAGKSQVWLPFILRFYLYAGSNCIRMVYTLLYDGDPNCDQVGGVGLSLLLSLSGEPHNRHIRFAGDTGLFYEPARLLPAPRFRQWYAEYQEQLSGRSLDLNAASNLPELVADMPVWNDFLLLQDSADHYEIKKRTQEGCCWLTASHGARAQGLVFAGGNDGGLALGVKDFWRKHPSALEVAGLAAAQTTVTAWLWPPTAPAMDLRHYDTKPHVAAAYEGFAEMRATPYGIGNTSELYLWCLDEVPAHSELMELSRLASHPPLLVCDPARYHMMGILGPWSLPDRSTPLKERLENQLDAAVAFYLNEVEQRRWYGFWHYGDVMHSYDAWRHTWRYDTGGFAWMNTELVPNLWLWIMFLRSGRADIFRLAEAMTRHTSEVDVYHFGPYAGLGTRHNVVHWGCACKEARIAMAGLHRAYYYLTADERIGDIMHEVRDADYATVRLDPMRSYFPPGEHPTHTRSGPDWAAFVSNWLTEWERFGDTRYRDKIAAGIRCLKAMDRRLLSGPTFGYNPETGELFWMGDNNYSYHMVVAFGAPQVWIELADLLRDPEWVDMLVEFGAADWPPKVFFAALQAYAAWHRRDHDLAKKTWNNLCTGENGLMCNIATATRAVSAPESVRPLHEIPWISTGLVSQWSLAVLMCLELIPAALPSDLAAGAT